ncbi:unnamed protein product [Adineta ricciae]|uniref:Uncharacterized protein n=1 Tax=Adineta ricciae TaxID=249248 RepID=A0A816AD94_ADIRI|nr:unnamed protein product [Adineta ricciae]CAF1596221.1 unnamed protein product [Adineta ricciae]
MISTFSLTLLFSLINVAILLHIEQSTLETRVKHADTILFGRFNWESFVSAEKYNTFEFIVYCTIKKSKPPANVPRSIRVIISDNATEIDMKKNRWFILFPKMSQTRNTWIVNDRNDAFDLDDDLELRIFEQFCFLKPKLPYGFPNIGLLDRCPKPSSEHCLSNGTRIRHDELLELKTFLTSTTTRKSKLKTTIVKHKEFIKPVW